MTKQKIAAFWQWFAQNAHRFDDPTHIDQFTAELDDQVNTLGDFSWEVGPGYQAANMFVLSPSGDRDKLQQTRAFISSAPSLENWEFYPAKQPIQGKLNFILYTDEAGFEFDASVWQYVLFRFPDNSFDIVIKADNIKDLSQTGQDMASRLAIDALIGEEKRIELFEVIDIVAEFEEENKPSASSFLHLPDHLKKIYRPVL